MHIHIGNSIASGLPAQWQSLFETSFGRCLGDSRVVWGPGVDRRLSDAGAIAQAIDARTILLSSQVWAMPYLARLAVIGHELAHTIQLTRGGSDDEAQLEVEAWRASWAALQGVSYVVCGGASRPLSTAWALIQANDVHPQNYYRSTAREPAHSGIISIAQTKTLSRMNLEAVLDELSKYQPKGKGSKLDILLVGHGNQWGLIMPVTAKRRAIQASASNLDLLRGPDTLANKAKKLRVTQAVVDGLLKKMRKVQGLAIGRVEFRACSIGSWPSQLTSYAEFFGAESAAAPNREDVFGSLRVYYPLNPVLNLSGWRTQTLRRLPRWFRRSAKSKDYLHAGTRMGMVVYGARARGNRWALVGLADSAKALRTWVGVHLPQSYRYGAARQNTRMGVMQVDVPVHFLTPSRGVLTPHFEGAFPRDPKYLKYIIQRRRASLRKRP